jgi:hypothetical protein
MRDVTPVVRTSSHVSLVFQWHLFQISLNKTEPRNRKNVNVFALLFVCTAFVRVPCASQEAGDAGIVFK